MNVYRTLILGLFSIVLSEKLFAYNIVIENAGLNQVIVYTNTGSQVSNPDAPNLHRFQCPAGKFCSGRVDGNTAHFMVTDGPNLIDQVGLDTEYTSFEAPEEPETIDMPEMPNPGMPTAPMPAPIGPMTY